ncbi:cytochrome P450 [Shimia thalassica]|uniref:cytochrome P450 n=1 Tax=Shimia thalassica TaxID=1715693 RepID=UPI002732CFE9|nr:cytochrome P450 [Shimia thalassica]MDP2494515.1 cytochrome P450 [Shimia thalassica]
MHDPSLPAYVPFATEPLGLMGSLRAARTNLLSILPELAVRQPMVSGRTGIRWHMVMEPGAIRRVLLENVDNYPKSKATKNILRPAIGDSLFIAEDAHWRWQRRTAAPVFSHRNVQSLGPIMIAAAQRSADRIATSNGRAVDLMEEMVRTTFDVISDVTFSGEGSFDSDAVHRSIDAYIAAAGKVSILDMLGVPDWVPRPSRFTSGPVVAQMKQVADQAIVERRKRGASAVPDLLDMLLSGQDPETKRKMNTAELRDNLLTFIVAGHETTALTLAWSTYLCAFAPEVQDEARAEIADVTSGGPVKTEHVGDLSYLRMIVDEALRLYPPAGILSRTAKESDVLCGRDIHPGDTVMLPVYALHRHHDLWKNPNAFDPERFADRKAVDRYAYLPFGDGPRICIGASFAIQEAVLILATLLQRFRFDLVAGRTPEPVMILTLRPDTGVWLTATPV